MAEIIVIKYLNKPIITHNIYLLLGIELGIQRGTGIWTKYLQLCYFFGFARIFYTFLHLLAPFYKFFAHNFLGSKLCLCYLPPSFSHLCIQSTSTGSKILKLNFFNNSEFRSFKIKEHLNIEIFETIIKTKLQVYISIYQDTV